MQVLTVDQVIPFGKYKGSSIRHLIANDEQYLRWCVANIVGFAIVGNEDEKNELKSAISNDYYGFDGAWPSCNQKLSLLGSAIIEAKGGGYYDGDDGISDGDSLGTDECSYGGDYGFDCEELGLEHDDACSCCH